MYNLMGMLSGAQLRVGFDRVEFGWETLWRRRWKCLGNPHFPRSLLGLEVSVDKGMVYVEDTVS